MRAYFLDSSALVKRYITEQGSDWIQELTSGHLAHLLIVSRITWVEVVSALARLQRESTLSTADVEQALQAFAYDWETQYQVVELDAVVAEIAGQLLQKHPLRAYDSIQLASAQRLLAAFTAENYSYTFVAADNRLLSAAQAEGLLTENPNNHP